MRAAWRRLSFGLLTVLGLAPRGFFIPYKHAGTVDPPAARQDYQAVSDLFDSCRLKFAAVLGLIDSHEPHLRELEHGKLAPRWDQDWFPPLDAATLYAFVRTYRPGVIVEVGCGHSTRFAARAVTDGGLPTLIVAIDPEPRGANALAMVEVIRKPVQRADPKIFSDLGPGDFLLIDSSHILMPGSDVDTLINRILPALPSGVFIHFHDVFLPRDYPAEWAWRGYNEQLAIVNLILGHGYEVIFASNYTAARLLPGMETHIAYRMAPLSKAPPSSLWLKKR